MATFNEVEYTPAEQATLVVVGTNAPVCTVCPSCFPKLLQDQLIQQQSNTKSGYVLTDAGRDMLRFIGHKEVAVAPSNVRFDPPPVPKPLKK